MPVSQGMVRSMSHEVPDRAVGEHGLDIPPPWRQGAEQILREPWRRLMIIGQTDAGKSSLCRYLAGRILDAGFGVAVVDADVGQKDIGPPATVTLGYPDRSRDFAETPPQAFAFVGSTNPIRHMTSVALGAARLAAAADAPFTIVNTPGVVHGPGRALQRRLADAVQPDAILALEQSGELAPIIAGQPERRFLRLPRSPAARNKSAAQRRAARQRKFAEYFATAAELHLGLDTVNFQRSGSREIRCGAQLLEAMPGNNLLSGVADGRGTELGLAIICAVDPVGRSASLITPVPRRRIKLLQLGELRLTRDGREQR